MASPRSGTAVKRAKRWNLIVKHALYRETGDWYHRYSQVPNDLMTEIRAPDILQNRRAGTRYLGAPRLDITKRKPHRDLRPQRDDDQNHQNHRQHHQRDLHPAQRMFARHLAGVAVDDDLERLRPVGVAH